MSITQGIQKRTSRGEHSFDAGNGAPATLSKGQVGDFQRGLDAYLKKRGLTQHPFKRKKGVA